MKQKQTHRHREQICGCQGGGEGGKDWEFGISRCKLVHRGWIKNNVLLYITGNYIQYSVINLMEKSMKKNIYIYNCHFAAQQKLTHIVNQLYFNKIFKNFLIKN